MNKTIFIKKAYRKLFAQAQEIADREKISLSELIARSLAATIAREGFSEKPVFVCPFANQTKGEN